MGDGAFHFVDIGGARYSRELAPNECPVCHYAVEPEEFCWSLAPAGIDRHAILESVFKCPRRECGHLFIGRYWRDDSPGKPTVPGIPGIREFRFLEAVAATPLRPQVPHEVAAVSPSFVDVYGQALAAETFGLDQIAGVGLRKALEFLIKDFCVSTRPDDAPAIRTAPLAKCIRDFVDSGQVVSVAERAAWLGNDETHYERRWSEMDIANLKELIQLTVNWIHSSLLTVKYEQDMPGA